MKSRTPTLHPEIPVRSVIMSLLLSVTLLLAGCNMTVQPVERYQSPDGLYALDYPIVWDIINESTDFDLSTVLFGTDPGLIEMDDIPSGESAMGVMLMPDLIPISASETSQLSAAEFGAMVQMQASATEERATPLEEVEIDDMEGVYRFTASSESAARSVYFFTPAEGLIAVYVLAYGAQDDNTELLQMTEESIQSFSVIGDAEEFRKNTQVPRVTKP